MREMGGLYVFAANPLSYVYWSSVTWGTLIRTYKQTRNATPLAATLSAYAIMVSFIGVDNE